MRTILFLAFLVAFLSCSKDATSPSDPWNRVTLQASVSHGAINTGAPEVWKTTVTSDKAVYDSIFVVVQWDVYAAAGAYMGTKKDTVGIAPGISGMVHHLTRYPYMPPWSSDEVKIVYAWSTAWNKYELRYQ